MRLTQDNLLAEFMRAGELQTAGRLAEAAALWAEVARAAPQSAEAHANHAATLLELGAFEAAEREVRQAVALVPEAAWAHYHLGRFFHMTRRWAEAEAAYLQALRLEPRDPKVRLALGYLHLGLGDYARAWPFYEARSQVAGQNAERLALPGEWLGEALAGRRLLIWPEQGFGDQIQFARFAPVLRDLGAEVTLVAPPNLTPLFAGLGVGLLDQWMDLVLPPTDAWSLLLSIPGRLGTTLETLPSAPYLAAPADRRAQWRGFAPKGGVGVVWRGRPTHGADRHRSLPSKDLLKPLAEAGANLIDLTQAEGDFADLAAMVEQLDLVVTVDTAIGHLAGALGKPCWLLLPWFRTDWRWLQDREDSPWYPQHRLFRQPTFGDWASPIAAVAEAWRAQFGS
ncbi:MAG: tetratricopeptide repeat protein [Phenylobacterium sp.]|nr:MAG: tetratricopeptide repeat protein [Phenylobacterium sp.]